MTRHYSPDAIRQMEAEADAEVASSARAQFLLGIAEDEGDRGTDEHLIAEAKAFCVATINRMGRKLYLFRVAHALPCKSCGRWLAPTEYFTSSWAQIEEALAWATCLGCRRFTWPKGVKRPEFGA